MPKSKELKDKILESALQELDTLVPELEKERKVLPAAGKPSVSKKKIAKAVKEVAKKKAAKPKKAPLKMKRVDSEEATPKDVVVIQPPADPPLPANEKKVVTKLVVKDGVVIVEPVFNPFDD